MTQSLFPILGQDDAAAGGVLVLIFALIYLAIVVFTILGGWKMFEKAGQPGWAVIIPFYNAYIFLKIAGRPGWWLILLIIPIVSLIVGIIVCIDVAKAFGMGTGFGLGIAFLGVIFIPVLGFGSATYQGTPQAQAA